MFPLQIYISITLFTIYNIGSSWWGHEFCRRETSRFLYFVSGSLFMFRQIYKSLQDGCVRNLKVLPLYYGVTTETSPLNETLSVSLCWKNKETFDPNLMSLSGFQRRGIFLNLGFFPSSVIHVMVTLTESFRDHPTPPPFTNSQSN